MGNPYEIRGCPAEEASGDDECEACPAEDCRQDEMRIVWEEGFNAGLEAAAERCEAEHAELEEMARGRSGWFHALAEERALVSARLADEIRNMKGDNQ